MEMLQVSVASNSVTCNASPNDNLKEGYTMSKDQNQSLFIIAYKGTDTADAVYDVLHGLEKQDKVDIKTAATVYRKDNGKLKLKHKRRVTVWKGAFGGGAIALLLGGAVVGGALIGALIGASRSKERRNAKDFLDDKLGPDDSALVILIENADWEAVSVAIESFGGEELQVELSEEAQTQIAALAANDDVAEVVSEEVEVEDEEVAE